MMYGLKDKSDIVKLARRVIAVFGGGYNAERALVEIAAVETLSGTYPDRHPDKLGVGLTQFDQIGFDDVVQRTRPKNKKRALEMLGYNLDELVLADLAYDPLLALTMTRLKYMLVADAIPSTIEGRANYWKRHYNTVAGKGTVAEYVEKVAYYSA